ncbi:MAG TPA: tetratricopeptide repeat protein [Thermoanaerobaculia bacterium]|nr:tetratricopeptide repeat protein [Thermoanaerobaculia bacterium]
MKHRPLAVLLLLAITVLGLPGSATAQDLLARPLPEPPEHPALAALEPVPAPSLEGLEAAVVEQLAEARLEAERRLATSLAAGEPAAAVHLAFGRLGQHYHAYGLLAAAEPAYRNAARLEPDDPAWPFYLGRVLHEAGRLDEAVAAYGEALALHGEDVPALVFSGEVRLEQARTAEAAELAARAVAVAPRSPAALALVGQVALAEERYQDAAAALEAALAAAPAAARLHYLLGLAYRGLGREEEAREHLVQRSEVGVRPTDPRLEALEALRTGERIEMLRGRRAFDVGRYEDAARHFRRALAAAPDSTPARVNLAAALTAAGDRATALAELERVLAQEPGNVTALYNLGTLLVAEGRLVEGIERLRAAVEGSPQDAGLQLELAEALTGLGAPVVAFPHYRRALELGSADERALLGTAAGRVARREYAEAREVLEAGHAARPESGRIAQALARLLAAAPDPQVRDAERAVSLAEAVHAARPTPWNAETVALALAEAGRCDEAATWQRRVIEGSAESTPPRAAELAAALDRYVTQRPCRPPVEIQND